MVPREPSDIARIGMLGAKRELLPHTAHPVINYGFSVHFTSMTPEVAAFFQSLLAVHVVS